MFSRLSASNVRRNSVSISEFSIPNSDISVPHSEIFVSNSEKVSDPRPRVARPPPDGHVTRARGSRDPRARVADFLPKQNGI